MGRETMSTFKPGAPRRLRYCARRQSKPSRRSSRKEPTSPTSNVVDKCSASKGKKDTLSVPLPKFRSPRSHCNVCENSINGHHPLEKRRPKTAICGSRRAHSITSSAALRSDAGIVMPSTLAVSRLTTNSNLVGCWTGRSAGLAPFKMRPIYMPVW